MPPTPPEDERPDPEDAGPEDSALPPTDTGADDRSEAQREATEFGGE
jgi:hypothetical protein